ncbi:MAG: hypothetical protein JRH20_23420 [Deltaproteobacteria bacterium]|nr:hypothetical protein [Deltaproteobacteria bacterium]
MNATDKTTLPAPVQLLLEAAQRAPSADNTQPWSFSWDGHALHVGFDPARIEGHVFTPESRASQLSMGAIYENIQQVARTAGLTLGGASPSSQVTTNLRMVVPRLSLSGIARDEWITAQRAHPVFERHTNREVYTRDPLPNDLLGRLEGLQQDSTCVKVFSQRRDIKRIASLVRLASEARFRTRELHEWLYGSLRFPGDGMPTDDGLALETLGLPPGGGAMLKALTNWGTMSRLNRFKLFKLLALMETVTFQQAPALVAILAPKSPEHGHQAQLFAAGQLMERAWVAINEAGFAAHPSYVITDQLDRLEAGKVPLELRATVGELQRSSNGAFVEGGHALCVLFRVGRAKREAVRSRRRPLHAMLSVQAKGVAA